jgi:hypothetical protein
MKYAQGTAFFEAPKYSELANAARCRVCKYLAKLYTE